MGGYLSQDPIGLAGGNPTLYGYVFDTNIGLDVLGLDCSGDAAKLRANMKASNIPEPTYPNSAHHKVMSNSTDKRMIALRAKMDRLGIDINDADNGVFLPRSSAVKEASGVDLIAHSRVHTNQYIQYVYDRLMPATTETTFRAALRSITF